MILVRGEKVHYDSAIILAQGLQDLPSPLKERAKSILSLLQAHRSQKALVVSPMLMSLLQEMREDLLGTAYENIVRGIFVSLAELQEARSERE